MTIIIDFPDKKVKLLKVEQIICYGSRRTGKRYNARIDDALARLDLTETQLDQYIQENI